MGYRVRVRVRARARARARVRVSERRAHLAWSPSMQVRLANLKRGGHRVHRLRRTCLCRQTVVSVATVSVATVSVATVSVAMVSVAMVSVRP